jgi:thiosulfate/3-mercaptopyruvate sulfurtransferase
MTGIGQLGSVPAIPPPVIGPRRLRAMLEGPRPVPVVLDVRWSLTGPPGRDDYRAGHLPTAAFLDLDTDLAGPPARDERGRHPLPDAGTLRRTMCAVGVRPGRTVVAYDGGDGSVAARAWWLLRWLGHPWVAVLDGGYRAWVADGLPITTDEPAALPDGDDEPAGWAAAGAMPVLDADGAAAVAARGVLLDARAPQRYRGDTEPVDPVAGHIPGAVNSPFADHLAETGRWRGPAELAARFASLGVGPGSPVAAYCGSGVTACSTILALEYAGLATPRRPAALYAGSWSGWVARHRPAATGSGPPDEPGVRR